MASFKLNPTEKLVVQQPPEDRIRMGSISLFALVIIICLAVLAVLSFSTANASLTMSQRQATAMHEMYADETAAQRFVAELDAVMAGERTVAQRGNTTVDDDGDRGDAAQTANDDDVAGQRGSRATEAIIASLDEICAKAEAAAGGQVSVNANVVDNKVYADFSCEGGRVLNIVVIVRNNSTYRIDKWRMIAVQNMEEPEGQLLIIN